MARADASAPDQPARRTALGAADGRGERRPRRERRPAHTAEPQHPGGAPATVPAPAPAPVSTLVLVLAAYGAALALSVAALCLTARRGVEAPGTALAFGALIAVGEAVRCRVAPARCREPAPLATTGALGYVALGEVAGAGGEVAQVTGPFDWAQAVAVVVAASLAGLVPPVALGQSAHPERVARRVLAVACAALGCQCLHDGTPLGLPTGVESLVVPCLLALFGLALLSEAALAALFAWARGGGPYAALLGTELRARRVVGAAVCAASVVLALAVATAGEWALPLCGVPLLLAQLAVRRRAAGREADRQTVASLARATEIAGYTPPGHARRVARLGRAVGRELGLSGRALAVIEDAALLHDVGQLSLVDPYPAGATEPLPASEARRIARLGGAVVRQTGMPAEVADAVERQAAPYREQPLPARVIRVVNAYADLTGDPGAPSRREPPGVCGAGERAGGRAGRDGGEGRAAAGGPPWALGRLWEGTEREYDPEVVAALARVVRRDADA
ncbi:HD-GYP domain-containing protein [Streptomyces youssoufiensis]